MGQSDVASPGSAPEPPGQIELCLWQQRSPPSPGEAVEKGGNREIGSLLRPCGYLGQNSRPGRHRELGPTTPKANNSHSCWHSREAQGCPCTPVFLESTMLRDREFPAKHRPIVPVHLDPEEQGEQAALGHISKLPTALQEISKCGTAHPKNLQEDLHQGEKCGGQFITGVGV